MSIKRQTLLETATRLFAGYGYHAVGVDRIIAESSVAKMTMYKYFPSKSTLVVEVLQERDKLFRASLSEFVSQFDTPMAQLEAAFTWHHKWFTGDSFNGCMFINAAAEFHDVQDEIRMMSSEHKQRIIDFLQNILAQLYPAPTAAQLAIQLNMVLDGAIVSAYVMNDHDAATKAWVIARQLLANPSC